MGRLPSPGDRAGAAGPRVTDEQAAELALRLEVVVALKRRDDVDPRWLLEHVVAAAQDRY